MPLPTTQAPEILRGPGVDAKALVEKAFSRLAELRGFSSRPQQVHLARLLSDLIEGGQSGIFEAPTGLGKSLAALVPAIANAIVNKRRTVIATYTNVLAEQYWRSDLPLALSLFEGQEDPLPKVSLLMGRQRYACLEAVDGAAPDLVRKLITAPIGHETDFRNLCGASERQANALWKQVVAPPVCPARSCRFYGDCFYYGARREAQEAAVVITNHSVVVQHALMAKRDDSEGLLGDYDFLIIDEAHDFPLAAQNGLEFELSPARIRSMGGIAGRIENALQAMAANAGDEDEWKDACLEFKNELQRSSQELIGLGLYLNRPGILECAPESLSQHPQVAANLSSDLRLEVGQVAKMLSTACASFDRQVEDSLSRWQSEMPEGVRRASDEIRNYRAYINEVSRASDELFSCQGVAVTYLGRTGQDPMVRQDVIALAEPLSELIWNVTPYVCISATAALDEGFSFFKRLTGATPEFEEILPSPFDFSIQSAVYLPKVGIVPDPSSARKEGREEAYFDAIARELEKIVTVCQGRTLALFHSRREMEAVFERMRLPDDLPILLQHRQNAAGTGEKFKKETRSSLFALRSFWTGFDAPGETLSCVTLVRVPFEVPVDPPQIARMAYLQTQGLNAFSEHTLPLAKMLMRQGAGRLIRSADDKGLIALLDPRLRTKRYGEEILDNLPRGMRVFDDVEDAVGFLCL
jgi:ATP-dependent DNA helicase DinG